MIEINILMNKKPLPIKKVASTLMLLINLLISYQRYHQKKKAIKSLKI